LRQLQLTNALNSPRSRTGKVASLSCCAAFWCQDTYSHKRFMLHWDLV